MTLTVEGPVAADSPDYINRQLDQEVLRDIRDGLYVTIRGGRQTGKTSLVYRMRAALLDVGIASAYVDLAPIQGARNWAEWMDHFASSIETTFLPTDLQGSLPIQPTRLDELRDYLLSFPSSIGHDWVVAIFMDEVATVPEAMRQPLFSTIRTIYNLRSDPASPPAANNTVFVFVGTFNPQKMIIGENSPFNVARNFDTADYDYTIDQVRTLAERLSLLDVVEDVYELTSGHPYITNRTLNLIAEGTELTSVPSTLLRGDPNLSHFATKLREAGPQVLALAIKITRGEKISYGLGMSNALDELITIGAVKSDIEGNCTPRCSLYADMIDRLRNLGGPKDHIGFL